MKTERIGSRGVLFTLEEHESAFASDYCVYLIEGENTVYLCDTHVGPRSMEPSGDYMRENGLDKRNWSSSSPIPTGTMSGALAPFPRPRWWPSTGR